MGLIDNREGVLDERASANWKAQFHPQLYRVEIILAPREILRPPRGRFYKPRGIYAVRTDSTGAVPLY